MGMCASDGQNRGFGDLPFNQKPRKIAIKRIERPTIAGIGVLFLFTTGFALCKSSLFCLERVGWYDERSFECWTS